MPGAGGRGHNGVARCSPGGRGPRGFRARAALLGPSGSPRHTSVSHGRSVPALELGAQAGVHPRCGECVFEPGVEIRGCGDAHAVCL